MVLCNAEIKWDLLKVFSAKPSFKCRTGETVKTKLQLGFSTEIVNKIDSILCAIISGDNNVSRALVIASDAALNATLEGASSGNASLTSDTDNIIEFDSFNDSLTIQKIYDIIESSKGDKPVFLQIKDGAHKFIYNFKNNTSEKVKSFIEEIIRMEKQNA
jgi:hypothetical protein